MKNLDKKILVGTLNYINILIKEYGEEALMTDVIDAELQKQFINPAARLRWQPDGYSFRATGRPT